MISRHVTSKFDALLDERLSAAKRERVETHLRQCDACRKAWEEYVALWQKVGRLSPVSASTGFTDRVLRDLENSPVAVFNSSYSLALRWAMAGAGVAVVAAAVWVAVLLSQRPPSVAEAPPEQRVVMRVAENFELLQDFELIAVLDQLLKERQSTEPKSKGTL